MKAKYLFRTLSAEAVVSLKGVDYVIIAVILLVIVAIIISMVRHRKKGGGCYGCPHSKACGMCRSACPSNNRGVPFDAE